MRDANRRIGGVYRLPAGPGGTKRVDADILGIDLDLHFVGFRQHRHGDRRGVDAALLLGFRNALHAVDAALIFQRLYTLLPLTRAMTSFNPAHRRFADRRDFHAPALRFRVAAIHAEDLGRKQRGFIAARAGADFEHDVLFVEGILGEQQNLQLLFDPGQLRLQALHLVGGHLAQLGVGVFEHGPRIVQIAFDVLILAVLRYDLFDAPTAPWRFCDSFRHRR